MKKIINFTLFSSLLFISSCGIFQDYTECGWLRVNDDYLDKFYQVDNNGDPRTLNRIGDVWYGDDVKKCNYIHLYKDDDEFEIEQEDGSTRVISLSNIDYEYGKL